LPLPNDENISPEDIALREAGKRMAECINSHLAFHQPWEIRDKWLAARLDDGSCGSDVYDTMADAKRFRDPDFHCYFAFRAFLGGISARECSLFIEFHRDARKAGLPQADPDRQPFMSVEKHDNRLDRLNARLRLPQTCTFPGS
jgi:hypothetical protein